MNALKLSIQRVVIFRLSDDLLCYASQYTLTPVLVLVSRIETILKWTISRNISSKCSRTCFPQLTDIAGGLDDVQNGRIARNFHLHQIMAEFNKKRKLRLHYVKLHYRFGAVLSTYHKEY